MKQRNPSMQTPIQPQASEISIQRAILDYLSLRKIFHIRINSGAFKTERGGFYRMAVKGCADILICSKGRFIAAEVKRPGGRLSEAQIAFKEELEAASGVYLVVTSLDEMIGELQYYSVVK